VYVPKLNRVEEEGNFAALFGVIKNRPWWLSSLSQSNSQKNQVVQACVTADI
jgi:hypothetical protein